MHQNFTSQLNTAIMPTRTIILIVCNLQLYVIRGRMDEMLRSV